MLGTLVENKVKLLKEPLLNSRIGAMEVFRELNPAASGEDASETVNSTTSVLESNGRGFGLIQWQHLLDETSYRNLTSLESSGDKGVMTERLHDVTQIETIVTDSGPEDKVSQKKTTMEFVLEPLDVGGSTRRSPVVSGDWSAMRHKKNQSVVIYSIYNVLHDDFKHDFETKVISTMTMLTRAEDGCVSYDWFKDVNYQFNNS